MVTPSFYLRILGRTYPAFFFLGVSGYVAGVALCFLLAGLSGLSPWVIAALSATAAATCLGLIWISKVITGVENIVYYRHEIAVLLTGALLLRLSGQPVLPYLDVALLGVGLMMAVGRWGCLFAGCCHGKPWGCRVGVTYGPAHAREGFPAYFVGLRMFPMPALESLLTLAVVLVGVSALVSGARPGTAIVAYTALYGAARFILEYFRGDAARAYLWHFSEAQWTSLALMGATLLLSLFQWLPFYAWHLLTAAAMALIALVTAIHHGLEGSSRHVLLSPRHIREIASALKRLAVQHPAAGSDDTGSVPLVSTSAGLTISSGTVRRGRDLLHHYTLSSNRKALTEKAARRIAELLVEIQHRDHTFQIASHQKGIHHIVFRT